MSRLAVFVDLVECDLYEGPKLLRDAGFDVRTAVARTPGEVAAAAQGAAALLTGDAPVTDSVLAAIPELRIVATVTAGIDQVDVEAARERGVWVANVPDAYTEEVAVHALAMMLAVLRQLPRYDRHVRDGGWDPMEGTWPARPSELTLGIVGLGHIGARLATLARPLFGRLLGHDPVSAAPVSMEAVGLDRLLSESDVVSLHTPMTPHTRGLIGHAELGRMRPGALLVNVSRGGLVDEAALLHALDGGHLAGACLDVLAEEPPGDSPLLHHPAVLLSPHAAFLSARSAREGVVRQVANVAAWARDGRPLSVVVEGRP
jgi:phosphoglycerate dehydrogenase-like enzyme